MKGFERENQLFSLCGLNCGLCSMRMGGHCGGCGKGNQSCRIARCSLEHGKIAYCFECPAYPCDKYNGIDDYDIFITCANRRADIEKARTLGIESYNEIQREKVLLLNKLLNEYNDGRRKTFFFLAVNLLDLEDIKTALDQVEKIPGLDRMEIKEKSAHVVRLIQSAADSRGISLKLRKKPADSGLANSSETC